MLEHRELDIQYPQYLAEEVTIETATPLENMTVTEAVHNGITEEQVQHIAEITVLQSESPVWKFQRKGRITASKMHQVISKVSVDGAIEGETYSLTASILGYYEEPETAKSIRWGKHNEEQARRLYSAQEKQHHKHFNVGTIWATDMPKQALHCC